MSRVQGSHRGHETHGTVVEELFAAPLTEGGDLAEDFDGGFGDRKIARSLL